MKQLSSGAWVRPAVASDLPRIAELLEADALGPAGGLPGPSADGYARAFEEICEEPSNELWVATRADGDVIGTLQLVFFTTLSWNAARRAQLAGVRVAESERGQGTGSDFVRWAVERARSKGCRLVQLSSDKRRTAAHRFYARLGFVPSHEGLRLVLQ